MLESHLSYPALAYFRSQHYNQSWLAALTAILDSSALVMVTREGACVRQASLTFAMARHAVVDLAQVFNTPPDWTAQRLTDAEAAQLRARLHEAGLSRRDEASATHRFEDLRDLYEPYVVALARYLAVLLPPWVREAERPDNWQTSAWERPSTLPASGATPTPDDHF